MCKKVSSFVESSKDPIAQCLGPKWHNLWVNKQIANLWNPRIQFHIRVADVWWPMPWAWSIGIPNTNRLFLNEQFYRNHSRLAPPQIKCTNRVRSAIFACLPLAETPPCKHKEAIKVLLCLFAPREDPRWTVYGGNRRENTVDNRCQLGNFGWFLWEWSTFYWRSPCVIDLLTMVMKLVDSVFVKTTFSSHELLLADE